VVPRPKTVEDVQELTLDELLIWLAAMYGDRLKKAGECLPGRRAMRRYSNAQSGSPRTNECGASLSPGAETFALPSLRSSSSTLSRPSRQPTDHQLTQLALSAQSPCSCGIRRSVVSRGDHLRGGGRQGIPRARSRGRGTPVLGRLPASRRSYCPPHTSPAPQVPGALGARSTGAPPVAAVAAWVSGRPPLSLRPPDVMGRGAAASPRTKESSASLSLSDRARVHARLGSDSRGVVADPNAIWMAPRQSPQCDRSSVLWCACTPSSTTLSRPNFPLGRSRGGRAAPAVRVKAAGAARRLRRSHAVIGHPAWLARHRGRPPLVRSGSADRKGVQVDDRGRGHAHTRPKRLILLSSLR